MSNNVKANINTSYSLDITATQHNLSASEAQTAPEHIKQKAPSYAVGRHTQTELDETLSANRY